MTLSKCLKLSITLFFVVMICTSCQNNKEEGPGDYITSNELKRLSEKRATLNWNDFDKYSFEDIGSGVYIRKYQIEGERQLLVRGKSLENKPEQITIIEPNGKEQDFTPEIVSEIYNLK